MKAESRRRWRYVGWWWDVDGHCCVPFILWRALVSLTPLNPDTLWFVMYLSDGEQTLPLTYHPWLSPSSDLFCSLLNLLWLRACIREWGELHLEVPEVWTRMFPRVSNTRDLQCSAHRCLLDHYVWQCLMILLAVNPGRPSVFHVAFKSVSFAALKKEWMTRAPEL